jgi:hypothetical protein
MATFQLEEYVWLAIDPIRGLAHCALADKRLDFLCKLLTRNYSYKHSDLYMAHMILLQCVRVHVCAM